MALKTGMPKHPGVFKSSVEGWRCPYCAKPLNIFAVLRDYIENPTAQAARHYKHST